MEAGVPARLTAREGRRFAFPVGIAFLGLAALVRWRGGETVPILFAVIGAMLLLAGLLLPTRLGPVQRGWMRMALAISKVTTPIIMSLVFFITIVPIGLVMRLLGRNPVVHRERDGGYWVARSGDTGDLRRQF